MNNRKENIDDISKIFNSDGDRNIFKKHIDYIRFPFFKSFDENLKINFDFPITFLVGQNGSGKSSLLQALYGAPLGNSVENYWYTTALDPIKDLKENRHCFIYSFKTEFTKTQVEVLKERIQKKDNPDYWEPARAKLSYGMPKFSGADDSREASTTRWNLIKNDVLYMDFRYSLSAYDKYFYFGVKPNTKTLTKKQDIIRKYAPKLKESFEKDTKTFFNSKRKADAPIQLSKYEIYIIENILGKKYIEAKFIEHSYYDKSKGFAIRYKTDTLSYSEAYAGSGEVAIVKLVHDIVNAKDYSLILLDEPETSLHPTAQKKLIDFIVEQTKRKKLQVIISTHSPDIVEDMPKESIKILYENINTGKVNIIEDVNPLNAFLHIGRSFSDKKIIVVEDNLAKLIVDKILAKQNDTGLFDVKFFPSGASIIKKENMLVYSKEEDTKHFILFDGDQSREKVDINKLSENDKELDKLEEVIKEITGIDIKFNHDTNRPDQKVDLMLKYIKYHKENVFFLPKQIPEEIIWDNDVLERADILPEERDEIKQKVELKDKFNLFAKYNYGDNTSDYQFKAYEYFLTRWLKKGDDNYSKIVELINEIKER